MNRMIFWFLCLTVLGAGCKSSIDADKLEYSNAIPCEGNSWIVNEPVWEKEMIGKEGIQNWTSPDARIRTYFKTEKAGTINVGLVAKADNSAEIKVTLGDRSEIVEIHNTDFDSIGVSQFQITAPGYHFIEMQGLQKEGENYPDVQAVLIGGEAMVCQRRFLLGTPWTFGALRISDTGKYRRCGLFL